MDNGNELENIVSTQGGQNLDGTREAAAVCMGRLVFVQASGQACKKKVQLYKAIARVAFCQTWDDRVGA
jgi:hypothetical protein